MVEQIVINTRKDGTCKDISWYVKGGKSNFTAWNGTGGFSQTAVLEIYEDDDDSDCELVHQEIIKFQGYGTHDEREGGHYIRFIKGKDGDISPTLTTLPNLGLAVLEEYEEDSDGEIDESDFCGF